jgi:NADH-quinone oxidoreductase subunit F
MMATPHTLVEGVIISSYAIGCATRSSTCAARSARDPPAAAGRARGLRGRLPRARTSSAPATTSTSSCTPVRRRLHLRRGDGAARLARGPPRPAPPAPAVPGGRRACTPRRRWSTTSRPSPRCPTIIARARLVLLDGHREVQGLHGIYSLSGHVKPARASSRRRWASRCASCSSWPAASARATSSSSGRRAGRRPRSSPPTPRPAARLRGHGGAGSMLGTKALQIFDETTSVVRTCCAGSSSTSTSPAASAPPAARATGGWCRCCAKFEAGKADEGDIDKMLDVCDNIGGRSFCALADGAVACVTSAVKHFRDEFEAGLPHAGLGAVPLREERPVRGSRKEPRMSVDAKAGESRRPST